MKVMQQGIRRALGFGVALGAVAFAGVVLAASTGTELLRVTGGGGARNFGDYVSANTGLNTFYRFFVEVPPGTGNLTVEIFDPDFGAGGLVEEAADRDRQRTGFNSVVTYRLFDPSNVAQVLRFNRGNATATVGATVTGLLNAGGAAVSCTPVGTTTGDNNWCQMFTLASPAAGHWRIEIDTSTDGGDDVHAYGVRAHDGDATAGGTELNVYAESFVQIGVNQVDGAGSRNATFTLHPYAIRGCTADANDFDFDSGSALVVGGQAQQVVVSNRTGSYTTTFGNGLLSGNDVWANNVITTSGGVDPSGSITLRDGMGIWTTSSRINEVAGDAANYATLYYGADNAANPAPTAQPEANTFRIYVPADSGAAPSKPYLYQEVVWNSGPNPPVVGSTSTFTIRVWFVNPTASPITFTTAGTPDNVILARIPTDPGPDDVNFVVGTLGTTQGTATIAGGNRNITWNPGVVAAGADVFMAYQVTVLPEAAGTVTITGAGNATAFGNTLGTRADFYDETGILTSGGQADIPFGGLCPLAVTTTAPVPTPVTLSWLRATRVGGAIDLQWTTDSEYRHVGFDVFGRRGGAWIKLTTTPVPSQRGDSAEPQSYAVRVSAPADVEEIALDDIAFDGTRKRHPPLRVGGEFGTPPSARIDWGPIRAEHAAREQAERALGGTPAQAYLDVDADGIWRVSVSDLAAAGIDFASAPTAEVALVGATGPVPIAIEGAGGGVLGSAATIEFVGLQRDSLYGHVNTYLLAVDAASARRANLAEGAALPWPQTLASSYTDRFIQRDRAYSFASSTNDPWYDTRMQAVANYDFTINVDALVDATRASIALDVWGGTDFAEYANDHRVELSLNGTLIASQDFPGLRRELLRFELPPGLLVAGNNTVRVRLPGGAGPPFDVVHLERLAIGYERGFVASGGKLDATLGPPGDGAVSNSDILFREGFGDTPGACSADECAVVDAQGLSGPVRAYVASDAALLQLSDVTVAGTSARAIVPVGQRYRLFIAEQASVGTAGVRPVPAPVDPNTPPAELLVISHPDFAGASSLGTFVATRVGQGLSVRVVDTGSVYARYSQGLPDPEAIRRLLADAYASGTRYALLVGGDTYDYDNHLGVGAISFIPTPYTWTSDVVRYAPSDTLLGDVLDVDGLPGTDGLPDIAVGRWPVRTVAHLDTIVAKTLAYDGATHAGLALMVSGGSQPDLNFSTLSNDIETALAPVGWTVDRAAVDTLGASGANSALVNAINAGRALTNFVGHASIERWAVDATIAPLLTGGQAESLLTNGSVPTVIAQWGCWSSWFVSPSYNSMAHRFLLDVDGGAAAVIGAGSLVDTPQQDEYIRALFARLADGTTRIGDALDATRRDTALHNPQRRDLIYGISLLGDPTLRIRR